MTTTTNERISGQGNLLEAEDRQAIQRVAAGQPPHSQRAQALLALDRGVSQATAADQAGLTEGQVKYWLRKFQKGRLSIFPQEALSVAPALPDEPVEDLPGRMPLATADTLVKGSVREAISKQVEVTGELVLSNESSQEELKPSKKKKKSKKADRTAKDKKAGRGKGKKKKGKKKNQKVTAKDKGKKRKKTEESKKRQLKKGKKSRVEKKKKDKKRKGKKKTKKG